MHTNAHPHPAVATDIAVFTIRDGRLKLLLIRRGGAPYRGCWALPGGFVEIDEDLEACARRELEEETGVRAAWLEQLHAFGRPDRDPRERVITVAYCALVPSEQLRLRAATDAAAADWFDVQALPPLAFDHAEIIALARRRLAAKPDCPTLAVAFLPREFTLSELQAVCEIIRGQTLDKRNFRKQVLGLGMLAATRKTKRDGPHRPARLYRLRNPHRGDPVR